MNISKTINRLLHKPKILIITSGMIEKIEPFRLPTMRLKMDVSLAAFSQLNYSSFGREYVLKIGHTDVAVFDTIYIRMVWISREQATLLVNYAKKHEIKIVDRLYEKSLFLPASIVKSVEIARMIEAGIPIPKTIFGGLDYLAKVLPKEIGYPYILKASEGRKARNVWLIENAKQLRDQARNFSEIEKSGLSFFGTEVVKASQRTRVLVVGGKIIGAITRPAKWRKLFTSETDEGIKSKVDLSEEVANLAVKAAKAVDIDICGVDILTDDKTGKSYVIETNAAPVWKLVTKDCGVNVEEEVLKYLKTV